MRFLSTIMFSLFAIVIVIFAFQAMEDREVQTEDITTTIPDIISETTINETETTSLENFGPE